MPKDKAEDYIAIAHWLQGKEWHQGKTAVIGFSMGGTGVLKLVSDIPQQQNLSTKGRRLIEAVVAFYPECKRDKPPAAPTLPTLVHHGLSDELALAKRCKYDRLVHPNYHIKLYEGAHHTFDDNAPEVTGSNKNGVSKVLRRYNADADNISRMATRTFLDQHLRAPGN
jgi:dienelactone hydrolase